MKLTGMGSETVRPPRLALAGEEREGIQAIITRAIETRPKLVPREANAR